MVNIKVNISNSFCRWYLKRMVNNLLKEVPKSHLRELETIIIHYSFGSKNSNNAGLYRPKSHHKKAMIEISYQATFARKSLLFLFVPLLSKWVLAQVLYHEIGHHHHYILNHGINKRQREQYADNYFTERFREAISKWYVARYLLKPLGRVYSKIKQKKD